MSESARQVRDAGGAVALLGQGCCNLTDCVFLNNTAWGKVPLIRIPY